MLNTLAHVFANQMTRVAHDEKASCALAAEWKEKGEYRVVKFKKHGDRLGLRFKDGSKAFFTETGLEVPVEKVA